jgi:hypothetical protein
LGTFLSPEKERCKVARHLFPLSFRKKKAGQRKGLQTLPGGVCDTRGVARMTTLWSHLFGLCARILPAFASLRRSVATHDEAEKRALTCQVLLRQE